MPSSSSTSSTRTASGSSTSARARNSTQVAHPAAARCPRPRCPWCAAASRPCGSAGRRARASAGALLVDHDRRGVGLRVVVADRLDRAAVARRALVGDDDAPDRVLLRPTLLSLIRTAMRRREVSAADSAQRIAAASAAAGRASCPRPAAVISLRIWPNCLTSWLTAWTVVPEPVRDPLAPRAVDHLGLRALAGRHREDDRLEPVELALVDLRRPSAASSPAHARASSRAGSPSGPILRTCCICLRKSSSVNCCLRILRSSSAAWSSSNSPRPSRSATGRRPCRGSAPAIRSGWKRSSCVELLAGRGVEDRLAGDRLDRQRGAAAGVAVELGHHHAVELGRLGEALGDVDRVLAGHRVDDQQDVVGLGRACGSRPARPSAPRRRAGGRRCRRSARRGLAAWPGPAPTRRCRPGRASVPCS